MSQITITPDEMRSNASQCRSYGEEVLQVVNKSQTLVDGLQSQWRGAASQAFANQFASLRPYLEQCHQLLDDYARQMDAVAAAAEDFDQQVASQFQG